MRVHFNRGDGAGRVERRANQIGEIVNVAEVDGERALYRWIAAQTAGAAGPAANPWSVVHAAHHPQNRLASPEDVPGHTDPRFEINRPRLPESARSVWIGSQYH